MYLVLKISDGQVIRDFLVFVSAGFLQTSEVNALPPGHGKAALLQRSPVHHTRGAYIHYRIWTATVQIPHVGTQWLLQNSKGTPFRSKLNF